MFLKLLRIILPTRAPSRNALDPPKYQYHGKRIRKLWRARFRVRWGRGRGGEVWGVGGGPGGQGGGRVLACEHKRRRMQPTTLKHGSLKANEDKKGRMVRL